LAIDKTWPTLNKFLILLTSINEKKKNFRYLYKIWKKIISFVLEKKDEIEERY
jgi:hypothetical protein